MKEMLTYWPIEKLIAYARNPRKNDHAVDRMASAIREFGFRVPILAKSDGTVVDGHLRLKAAKKLELDTVPVLLADDMSEVQIKAFRISVNRMAELADWDTELLAVELDELKELGFDLELTGLEGEFIDKLMEPTPQEGLTDPDEVPEPPSEAVTRPGDVWVLGKHRLMCGDSTSIDDVEKLCEGQLVDMWLTDPPYNVNYKGGTKDALTIKNDSMADDQFRQFLRDAYTAADASMKGGAVFYIWHADSEGYNFRGAAKDAGWTVRQCLIWKKSTFVMGRQDYHWIHEPCQPAGTMVRTPSGEVPIETLKDGDRVVSFDKYSGTITGLRGGREVKVATRHYSGDLYGVTVGDKATWATDSHKFTVKFHNSARTVWCTYLMRRGSWWRVGITKTYDARGFGLKNRFKTEQADEAWIITTHRNKLDALCMEQILSVEYGIPRTHWTVDRGYGGEKNVRNGDHIALIYASLDLEKMDRNATDLLEANGRRRKFPFLTRAELSHKFSTRVTTEVQACNLIPEIMSVPIPYSKWDGLKTFDWQPIDAVDRRKHDGPVYSLDVEKDEHYVADGIVTHNCLYGWKDGAGHLWASDRKQTTVLEFNKPSANREHPTMKPVALFEYQMLNNTKADDVVLDSFGGSGTTLIAAEKNRRRARLMELDPKYCDVIIKRWQDFTGKDAVLESSGAAFNDQ